MNPTDDDLIKIVDALRAGSFTEDVLKQVEKIADKGRASQLVLAIVSSEQAFHKTKESAVSEINRKFESLAEISKPIACILMANLYPVAGELFMHHICDSIDLRMDDCDSDWLTHQLKQMVLFEEDVDYRRHFEQWIQNRVDL